MSIDALIDQSFSRLWGDEFTPNDAAISPMVNDLFEMHGFPEERAKAK